MLEVKNLTKKYGYIVALENINFSLDNGNILTLLGPNGAGKTTLLKLLATQIKPSSGEILYKNKPIKGSIFYKKLISVISHNSFLYNDLTAYQNLMFFARLYNISDIKNKVLQALEQVELIERKDHYVKNFSRGMLQRLTIARAFIHEPEILFMDEPYTGLDKKSTELLTRIIDNKKDKKHIIVLSTHNINIALYLADKIAILNKGRLVYYKDKTDLDEKDLNKYFDGID